MIGKRRFHITTSTVTYSGLMDAAHEESKKEGKRISISEVGNKFIEEGLARYYAEKEQPGQPTPPPPPDDIEEPVDGDDDEPPEEG